MGRVRSGIVNLQILLRGMPTDSCPTATCLYDGEVVYVQGNHSGPPYRSQTDDFTAILAPAKVFAPSLLVWMEQWLMLVRQWIKGFDLCPLELVARMASQTQVFPYSLPTSSFGNDVVYHQARSCDGCQGMAISTPIAEFGQHTLAQRPGNVGFHWGSCNSSGKGILCPRHFNNI